MKVLYIGGAGRSGSTLLEMILSNLSGFFSIGEVRYFWEYLVRGNVICGCGVRLNSCDFWSTVMRHLDSDCSVDFEHMALLSKRLNRTRSMPRIAAANIPLEFLREWGELIRGTKALYRKVFQEANCDVLVDASKIPSHLSILRRIPDIDLRVLHLVRDGRGVAYSWSKKQKKEPSIIGLKTMMPHRSMLPSIFRWAVENIYIGKMAHALPYSVMRYEDFVQNPIGELGGTLRRLGFKDINLGLLREPVMSLMSSHSVGGNPIRFCATNVSIVSDNVWLEKMPIVARLFLGLIAMPILSRYRYSLW